MRLPGRLPSGESVPGDRSRSIGVLRRAVQLGVDHIAAAALRLSADDLALLDAVGR